MTIRLILVGGFLGAGKTTLLLQAARLLAARGYRVGLVTNDQGSDLVDTALATGASIPVVEVSGGCFCCRFPDLITALHQLQETVAPDLILAEPVGSCTDIVATVVRPLRYYYEESFTIAPFTVVLDPLRPLDSLPATVRYLHQQQMAEAEVIVLNKLDLMAAADQERSRSSVAATYAEADVISCSARTGDGVEQWLDRVMAATSHTECSLDLDYSQYAEAEAALGWLNARGTLRADAPFSAAGWLQTLLKTLDDSFAAQDAPIAHIKVHLVSPAATFKASLTQTGALPTWDTDQTDDAIGGAAPELPRRAQFTLNVRVNAAPRVLERTVRRALDSITPSVGFQHDLTHFECFSPLPPQPTYRF